MLSSIFLSFYLTVIESPIILIWALAASSAVSKARASPPRPRLLDVIEEPQGIPVEFPLVRGDDAVRALRQRQRAADRPGLLPKRFDEVPYLNRILAAALQKVVPGDDDARVGNRDSPRDYRPFELAPRAGFRDRIVIAFDADEGIGIRFGPAEFADAVSRRRKRAERGLFLGEIVAAICVFPRHRVRDVILQLALVLEFVAEGKQIPPHAFPAVFDVAFLVPLPLALQVLTAKP